MEGIGDAIKYLYDKFLLRDVLSFIVPGAIVSIPAAYIINPNIVNYPLPWPFYILIFGAVYMLGFSLQCLGQLMGVIHHYPPDFSPWPWSERREMLPLKDLKDSYKGRRPI